MMQIIDLLVKFPKRKICKQEGHLLQQNNGFFGFFSPTYTWTCSRCGIRSKGDFDSLEKSGLLDKPNDAERKQNL